VNLRPARPEDLNHIAALLEPAGLPRAGVAESLGHFFVLESEQGIVATAGLESYDGVGLLRSVVVAPSHRGRGLAGRLCQRVGEHARTLGHEALYLLTLDAQEFFAGHGFQRVAREEAPECIRGSQEFSELCPDSATLMRRVL
jgi:N-acetylglutamate synthase-like GNAT family acetyltransferase